MNGINDYKLRWYQLDGEMVYELIIGREGGVLPSDVRVFNSLVEGMNSAYEEEEKLCQMK